MKSKSIMKSSIIIILLASSFSGCSLNYNTAKASSDKIVINKVETSTALIDVAKKDKEKDLGEEANLLSLELSDIESYEKFIENAKVIEPLKYDEEAKVEFEKTVEKLLESNNVFSNEKKYTYDKFMGEFFWDTISNTALYLEDINNDGIDDMMAIYKNSGSGNFSGISALFLKTENGYERSSDINSLLSNDIVLLKKDDKTYVKMTFEMEDEIYLWNDDSFIKIADESVFVNNDHISKDRKLIDNAIFKEFDITKKLLELKSKEIDYSNSGFSNEEILTTYFKIRKFIYEDNRSSLSELVIYPIMYEKDGKYIKVYNKEQFIESYDKIITDDIKNAVNESNYTEIFSNWRGAMIGSGEIWFTKYIIGIN